ncbi:MAG TPA: DUF3943 domain-containing protein [Polyangiales bacterium]|nr:DUF3943 domain-containing protein [Polyangiales bacterium]
MRLRLVQLSLCVLLSAPALVHAQLVTPLSAAGTARSTFEYVSPQAPDYLRASLEQVVLLGLGFTQYAANHDLNSVDWDFTYSWTGLRDKLSPHGYSFDSNGFDTNFIRHPAAGTTYYWAARSNRLSILEALAAAFVSSTLWEYIGELRERASLNDILVTPVTGMVLGELTLQLGAFFDRSCDLTSNRVLGALLGPIKTLHDAFDGATPLREVRCDRYGLSRRGEHRFELSITAGLVGNVAAPRSSARALTRLELHTQILALESYGSPGEGVFHFMDGNVSELRLSSSFAGSEWNDFTLRATVMPLGLHYRAISLDARGYELLFGLLLGTEYSVHRFGPWPGPWGLRDRYFELDMPGVGLQYRRLWGEVKLALEVQAHAAFVGIDALALAQARALPVAPTLPTIVRADGYNYALGVRIEPRASLSYRNIELALLLAAVRAQAITVNDRFEERSDYARDNERRTLAKLWFSVAPDNWPVRLTVQGVWLERWGQLGSASARRAELTAAGGVSAVF